MKLPKVTNEMVRLYKRGCRDSHDFEGAAICVSWVRLRKLKKYARHLPGCNKIALIRKHNKNGKEICTCGFDKL